MEIRGRKALLSSELLTYPQNLWEIRKNFGHSADQNLSAFSRHRDCDRTGILNLAELRTAVSQMKSQSE